MKTTYGHLSVVLLFSFTVCFFSNVNMFKYVVPSEASKFKQLDPPDPDAPEIIPTFNPFLLEKDLEKILGVHFA